MMMMIMITVANEGYSHIKCNLQNSETVIVQFLTLILVAIFEWFYRQWSELFVIRGCDFD